MLAFPQRRALFARGLVPGIAPAGRGVRRQYRDDAARRRHGVEGLRTIPPAASQGTMNSVIIGGHDPRVTDTKAGGPTAITRRSAAARAGARSGRATTASSAI